LPGRPDIASKGYTRFQCRDECRGKGRGLIVLTSCSHRGVINAIKQAQAASGVNKDHAVIGGFHLAPYKEDYVRDTITALKSMDIDYVIPLHW
jgi:7,8-dihydropterin-6-yl-methyl-4-(beta-D-ribofuranosyl)aminobenzene 5'-phosphate synthase